MRKIIPLLIAITLLQQSTISQTISNIQVFKRDTAFRSIVVDTNTNIVFAGTSGKGMVKFDQRIWSNWNGIGTGFKSGNLRQIAMLASGNVTVASSGYVFFLGSGEAGNNMNFLGGIYNFNSRISINRTYFRGRNVLGQQNPSASGPPTRNILGVYVDSTGRPWCVGSYQDSMTYPAFLNYNERYHFVPGAVGRFNGTNYSFITGPALPDPTGILLGVGNNYQSENYSIGKRRTCRSITQVGNEMWVGSDGYDQAAGNLITAGILRYNLDGTYISKYDENNTSVPFGLSNGSLGPWAMCKDSKGNVWVSMNGNKGIAVRDTGGVWTYIGVPTNLPTATIFRANSIACGKKGEVYFGTNNGLLEYKGKGAFTSDTAYKVYTTANGLSTNSIFSISVAKDQSVWMATDIGINKLIKGDLNIYTLKPSSLNNPFTDNDNFRRLIATYDSKKMQSEIDRDTLFIAADGSKATIFKWAGSDSKNLKFRIKNQTAGEEFGSFQVRYLNPTLNDSIRVQYTHPTFIDELYTVSGSTNGSRNLRLQLVDTVANPEVVVLEIPVKFVLPPVLMVHGLNSSGTTWDDVKATFLSNGLYKYLPYQISTPSYPNKAPFASNRNRIDGYITKLIEDCGDNRLSVGKVDIVGHSMGGILSRLYLQGGPAATTYQKTIHKLITINTPHSGSPLANIATNIGNDLRWIRINPELLQIPGALNDLSIGETPINNLLNGPNLNANIVPSHAIHSIDEFSTVTEVGWNALWTGADQVRNPYAQTFITLFKYWLTQRTSCSPDLPLNTCLPQIFGGPSDLIVADRSQTAGLTGSNQTLFNGLNHVNILKDATVAYKVLDLYRVKTTNPYFSTTGFHPVMTLVWNPTVGTQGRVSTNDSVRIISPAYGASYNRGDSAFITVRASNGVSRIFFAMGSEGIISSTTLVTPDSIFRIKIPTDVPGNVYYKVFGFDAQGAQSLTDSSYFQIGESAGVVLDSIKFSRETSNSIPELYIGDSSIFRLNGYYSDNSIRDITNLSGVVYSNTTASISTSNFRYTKGLIVGFDELKATFLGKADTLALEVVPVPAIIVGNPLPVRFTNITAQYNGENIQVNWATASEINNHHFEIEYSKNGIDFIKAGIVNASNNSSGDKYNFTHKNYIIGRNYYKIKQVDNDGSFSYSNIAVALVSEKNNITFYPNPVGELLVIDFMKAPNNFKKGSLIILNSLGQIIQKQEINTVGNKVFVNTTELAAGIYNIQIIGENKKQLWAEKFVKNR